MRRVSRGTVNKNSSRKPKPATEAKNEPRKRSANKSSSQQMNMRNFESDEPVNMNNE
jgi:hypothetical protein